MGGARRHGARLVALTAACAAFGFCVGATNASAVTVGDPVAPSVGAACPSGEATHAQTAVAAAPSYTVASAGNVTSFSTRAFDSTGSARIRFVVVRPGVGADEFVVVGFTQEVTPPASLPATPVTTAVTPIPVQPGNLIGFYWKSTAAFPCVAATGNAGDLSAIGNTSAPSTGATLSLFDFPGFRISVAAEVQPSTNTAPVCPDQYEIASSNEGTPITLACTDANNDPLTYSIVSGPSHGTLSGSGDIRTYHPVTDYTGPDSFTYKANDGNADSGTQTVNITVVPQCSDGRDNDINGHTDDPQDLGCTSSEDTVEDSTVDCPGTATASGNGGNDTFIGDDDPELMFGAGGSDFIAGQGGADCLFGGTGGDVVLGGAGGDELNGDAGADRVKGDTGADVIYGGAGGDAIVGGDGNDLINGEAGVDTVNAGAGNDRVVASNDGAKDSIDCGPGNTDVAIVDPNDTVVNCETVTIPIG